VKKQHKRGLAVVGFIILLVDPQWRRKRFSCRLPQRFARRLPDCRCKLRSSPGTAALDNCTRCRALDAIRLLSAK
jgi:hypothetical protein